MLTISVLLITQTYGNLLVIKSKYFEAALMKKNFIKHKALYLSIIINLIFLLLALFFCAPKYEASDDYIVDALLSGAFTGSYNPYMLFSNVILGKILVFLYTLIPYGSIYFWYLILSGFVGFLGICYVLLKKHPNFTGLLLSIIVVSFLSDDIYISINFTKIATVSMLSGGILIIYTFINETYKSRKSLLISMGTVEFLLGSFLRFQCVPMVLANLFMYVVLLFIQKNNRKSLFQLTIYSVILSIIAFALYQGNYYYRLQSHEDHTYMQNLSVNASVRDTPYSDYAVQKDLYDSLSYSENDFEALSIWNFVDKSIFPVENRATIGSYRVSCWKEYANNPSFCIIQLTSTLKKMLMYPALWALIFLLILMLLYKPTRLPYAVSILLLEYILLYYCIYQGRLNYRTEYSILLCSVILISLLFPIKTTINKHLCIALMGIILCAKIPLYIPDSSIATLSDNEYYELVDKTMFHGGEISFLRYKTNIYQRRSVGDLLDQIENDNNHYYIFEFLPYIQILYYNYKPWKRIPSNYLANNYSYLGGVTFDNAFCDYAFLKNGIDPENPNASLIDNDRIIFVSLNPEIETQYLKEHYCDSIKENIVGMYPYGYLIQYTSN